MLETSRKPGLRRRLLATLATAGILAGLLAVTPASVLAASCTPSGPAVPGAPLPGSCLEGSDGDQVDSDGSGPGNNRLDWQTVTAHGATDTTSGGNDTQFGPGGSELAPDTWTFDFGSLGSDKYDIVAGWQTQETPGPDMILGLAFVRASNNGTTHLAFELNQQTPGYRKALASHSGAVIDVPTRSAGDLLITYSVDPPVLGVCHWSGNEHSGKWLDFAGQDASGSNCPGLPANLAQGAMNASTITAANNFLQHNAASLDTKTFAEASLNLSQVVAIQAGTPSAPCFHFSYLWLHSRSSVSITSNQQDYILPTDAIDLGNCSVSGTKWRDGDGDGVREFGDNGLGGWTIYADYNDNGLLDAGEPFDVSAPKDAADPRAAGSYLISGLKAGTWKIREVAQPGWECRSPAPCSYALTAIVTTTGRDFGNWQAPPPPPPPTTPPTTPPTAPPTAAPTAVPTLAPTATPFSVVLAATGTPLILLPATDTATPPASSASPFAALVLLLIGGSALLLMPRRRRRR